MALNSVVPIRPRDVNDSQTSQSWQKWLMNVGAYSDLADSIIYRHLPQRELNTTAVSIYNDNTLGNILEDGKKLKKVAPLASKVKGRVSSDLPDDVSGRFGRWKDPAIPGAVPEKYVTARSVQDDSVWRHESQHAMLDKADNSSRYKRFENGFFDRKKGRLIPNGIYYGDARGVDRHVVEAIRNTSRELYKRSQDEYLANSAMDDVHPANGRPAKIVDIVGTKTGKVLGQVDKNNIPYNERVIRIRPSFMQNLKGITGGALGALGNIANISQIPEQGQIAKDVIDGKASPIEGYMKWTGTPYQTYDPTKEYL
jgi:hypothetical protein